MLVHEEFVMSAIAKENPGAAHDAGAELFDQLSALLARPRVRYPSVLATEVKKSVLRFHAEGSAAEVAALRLIVQEVVIQIDQLAPRDESGTVPEQFAPDQLARAAHEDALVDATLAGALHRAPRTMATPHSMRVGSNERANAVQAGAVTLKQRIERGELIGSGALQRALGVQRQAISAAMKAGRLFAFVGPSGENYYPAFYVDPALDRRAIEQVSKALGALPAASKYYFFTEQFTALQDTPLGALRNGRLAAVLAAAASVVGR
ncbi:hypothetical protein [Massilia sp. S19_KUP03_FR1]|uniref:hypothetical protein n=1 Tax=Massilia sp. S19_KUP03_FR1 TaxID=3025503 RepID=UPI002FCCBA98